MLGAMFISGGVDALRNPESKAPKAEAVAPALAEPIGLPEDPETLVQINGAVMVTGGVLLSLGRAPRLAATALAASLVPTTIAGHRFWEIDDPQARAGQRIHFFKNVAMLGGLILAAVDTEGRPSLGWRARRAARRARAALPIGD